MSSCRVLPGCVRCFLPAAHAASRVTVRNMREHCEFCGSMTQQHNEDAHTEQDAVTWPCRRDALSVY